MNRRGEAMSRTEQNRRDDFGRHKHRDNPINRQSKDHGLVDIIKHLFTRYAARFHVASATDQRNSFASGMLKPKATQTSFGPYRCIYLTRLVTWYIMSPEVTSPITVTDMNCNFPLEHCVRGFESHYSH
jgi:hypothetical protein